MCVLLLYRMPELPGTTVDAAADRRYPRPAAAIVRKRVDKDNTVGGEELVAEPA